MATQSTKKTNKTAAKPATKARTTSVKSMTASKTVPAIKKQVSTATKQTKAGKYAALRLWNAVLFALLTAQAAALVFLSNSNSVAVTANYATKDELQSGATGSEVFGTAVQTLFDVNVIWLVAATLIVAAAAHLALATIWQKRYNQELTKGLNTVRWASYALSGGIIAVTIGLLVGAQDVALLFGVFVFMVFTSLLACIGERRGNALGRLKLLDYLLAVKLGAAAWIILALYGIFSAVYGTGIQVYTYWLLGSMLALSIVFGLAVFLQFRGVGKWRDYLYAERCYMLIDFVIVTAFAWQVFFGFLR